MVNLLLRNKSPLNAADTEGYTPLHHAVAEGHGKLTFQQLSYVETNLTEQETLPSSY